MSARSERRATPPRSHPLRHALHALLTAAALCSLVPNAVAREAQPMSDDPVLEARVLHIATELRCLVCQNESIAASHADLAVDLRKQIRTQLRQGRTDDEIRDYMVQRYGDFVLYRPPLKPLTLMLWVGPFVLLAVGATVLVTNLRRRARSRAAPAPLSDADATRARRLLDGNDDGAGVPADDGGQSRVDAR